MRICGIIAEYNPFHSGHAYQVKQARALSGCEYVIVVMSGDFVQRGTPAIMDKYVRARAALQAGADLVLMLPVYGSTASAEGFARAGIAALKSCGVNCLSFGCEDVRLCSDEMQKLAAAMAREADSDTNTDADPALKLFQETLTQALSDGKNYASAKSIALQKYFTDHIQTFPDSSYNESFSDMDDPSSVKTNIDILHSDKLNSLEMSIDEVSALLKQPNNLLGFEYLRAMAYCDADFELFPVIRKGDYHGSGLSLIPDSYLSASEIRRMLTDIHALSSISAADQKAQHTSDLTVVLNHLTTSGQLPASTADELLDYANAYSFLNDDDMSELLHYALLSDVFTAGAAKRAFESSVNNGDQISGTTALPSGLEQYLDCSADLAARIRKLLPEYHSFTGFADLLKNKSVTHARVRRALCHILLRLPADMPAPLVRPDGTASYLRVLGFRESAAPLLHELKQHAAAPLITRVPAADGLLDDAAMTYFEQDLFASRLYHSMLLHKCGTVYEDDSKRRVEKIKTEIQRFLCNA